jgi:amino acid transporter
MGEAVSEEIAKQDAGVARLKANVIGPWGLAALVIGVTSPAIGLFAMWGPIEATAGPVVPLIFLGALAIILPTVLSYASLNRYAPSAGAAAVWLRIAANPTIGLIAGLAMTTYFLMTAITVPLLFALFFRDFLDWARVPIPGMAALVVGLILHSALIAMISLRGAAVSIKTTILLMLIETGVVLALSATILWTKAHQPGGINLHPFDPAAATQGFSGFWTAIILGILAFSGFDVVATAAEEAQAPREHVPRVLVFAVLGIGVFWALNAWALTLSTPPDAVARYNAQGLSAITPVARAYWGSGSLIVILTAFTGLTAIYLSCVQGASRLIFSMARQGVLPRVFARLEGEKRVPRNAILSVVLLCVAMGLVSLAALRDGLDSFVWWSGAMVFFASLTFTGVNAANFLYFRRILPDHFRVGRNLLVPVWGIGVSLYLLYAAFFSALWSAPFRTGKSIVIACLALFALELAAAIWLRLFRQGRLSASAPEDSGFEDRSGTIAPSLVLEAERGS